MALFVDVTLNMGDLGNPGKTGAPIQSAKRVQNLIEVLRSGAGSGTLKIRQSEVQAAGTYTLSSASGTITATINGVGVAVTASGGDTNTASLLAAAINASSDALVAGQVTASASGAVVTVTAVRGGICGNTQTTAASGTGLTADQTRLAGGAETLFSYSF